MEKVFRRILGPAAVVLAAACGRAPSPVITVNRSVSPTVVEVRDLPSRDIAALAGASLSSAEWQDILRVSVDGSQVPIAGRYSASGRVIRFTPLYELDPWQNYIARFYATRIPGADDAERWRRKPLARLIARTAGARRPATTVKAVYPSSAELPENVLRFYIEFSGPMGRAPALEHVRLIDEDGNHVVDPFLPVDMERWTRDRTRFTLLFDPGRVKRGMEPKRDLGRALIPGKRYALVTGDRWLDGRGRPLQSRHRHEFVVIPAIERPLDESQWKIEAPAAGTRAPLAVTFPWALDYGLLQRALSVRRDGIDVPGEIAIRDGETRWIFTPNESWMSGTYSLIALTLLEDPAGNRFGRAFEVMRPVREERDSVAVPFAVK